MDTCEYMLHMVGKCWYNAPNWQNQLHLAYTCNSDNSEKFHTAFLSVKYVSAL